MSTSNSHLMCTELAVNVSTGRSYNNAIHITWKHVYKLSLLTFSKGWKSVKDVPKLVDDYMNHKLKLDEFITEKLPLVQINKAFDLLKSGKRWDLSYVYINNNEKVYLAINIGAELLYRDKTVYVRKVFSNL